MTPKITGFLEIIPRFWGVGTQITGYLGIITIPKIILGVFLGTKIIIMQITTPEGFSAIIIRADFLGIISRKWTIIRVLYLEIKIIALAEMASSEIIRIREMGDFLGILLEIRGCLEITIPIWIWIWTKITEAKMGFLQIWAEIWAIRCRIWVILEIICNIWGLFFRASHFWPGQFSSNFRLSRPPPFANSPLLNPPLATNYLGFLEISRARKILAAQLDFWDLTTQNRKIPSIPSIRVARMSKCQILCHFQGKNSSFLQKYLAVGQIKGVFRAIWGKEAKEISEDPTQKHMGSLLRSWIPKFLARATSPIWISRDTILRSQWRGVLWPGLWFLISLSQNLCSREANLEFWGERGEMVGISQLLWP